ncbi:methyltransferase domain-containing protein [Natrarchaeobius sp. A-rgal3]|uniref:class I SAM-dependent methyltransferase n=1 Tax=Natrarchaeobius versutus TaxID=1679078 RepID=UPI0035109962
MTDYFETHGEMAENLTDDTKIAGRYGIQNVAERRILSDVSRKLQIEATDRCLDVGCGPGNITIPLSFVTAEVVAVDHPAVVTRLEKRAPERNEITTIGGDFLERSFEREFDSILIYSVLQELESRSQVFEFVEKARKLLAPGGRMLIGDLPNTDRKSRFLDAEFGQRFSEEWDKVMADSGESLDQFDGVEGTTFDDDVLLSLLEATRKEDCNSFLRSQPSDLPFGHTREDIVVERYPPADTEFDITPS